MMEAASKLVLSEVSGSSETTEQSLQSLKTFSRLLEESDRYARLIEKSQKYSDMVPPYILAEVQADYRKQKKEVDEKLKGQKEGFRKAYEEHLSEKEVLENISQKLRDRLKELRFRRIVGEMEEEDIQDQVRDLRRQLSESIERLDQMEEILDQYVIIGFDDLIEREDARKAEEASFLRGSSSAEEVDRDDDFQEEEDQDQEPEMPLPMLEEDSWRASDEEEESEPSLSYHASEYPKEDVPPPKRSPRSSAYPQGYLTILDGTRKGDRVPLIPADIMLGSSPNTDVMLTDQGIAESHARIYFKERKYFLENLDVLGRSYVNGIQSKVAELNHNDVIRLGNLNLRVDFTPLNS